MAEAARCGRRKQRNPKRKNVENDEVDTTVSKKKKQNVPVLEKPESNHDDSCPEDSNHDNTREATPDKATDIHDTSSLNGTDTSDPSDQLDSSDTLDPKTASANIASPKEEEMIPVKDTPTSNVKETQPIKSENQQVKADLPCQPPVCVAVTAGCVTEEEKIQEYMNRSDTAVIYPEPVSDHDGEEEEEDEDDSNKNDDSIIHPDEEIILKCIHCDQSFLRATLLRDHMKAMHADKPIKYLCPKCDETFLLKSQLDKHLALHSPTSQSCKICNKTFANVYRLQRHMISHDESTDLRKFKCPECGKAFKFKHHLKEHVRIHSGEKPFQCGNCMKRFSHSGSYSSHMTSKKCWVMNQNNKGRPVERSNIEHSPIVTSYSPIRPPVGMAMESALMQSLQPGKFPPQFLRFDPKGGLPAYYSPPTGSFIPMAYQIRHSTPLKSALSQSPLVTQQSPLECMPHQLTNSVSPSNLVHSAQQISPDVNSNTQLMCKQGSHLKTEVQKASLETPVVQDKASSPPTVPTASPVTIKTEKTSDTELPDNMEPLVSDVKQENSGEEVPCRFCGDMFQSPVDQHQHERYLCRLNKDIIHRIPSGESARNSPCSTLSDVEGEGSHRDTPNGSLSAETDNEDIEESYSKSDNKSSPMESKKFRMRSLISDEQLKVLKTHYQVNPRPRKYELIRIGNEISLPKRVVQVWFQNQRARDRRRGKNVPYFPSMARFKRQDSPTSWKEVPKTTQSYIPNVPTPYAHTSKINGKITPPKSQSQTATGEEQPLDLSVKVSKPPEAHSGSRPSSITPPSSRSGETSASGDLVLNLSTKAESPVPTPRSEGSLQNSAIYKYMQQEGLFAAAHRHILVNSILTASPTLIRPVITTAIPTRELSLTPTPSVSKQSDIDRQQDRPHSASPRHHTESTPEHGRDFENGGETDRLVIDEEHSNHSPESSNQSFDSSDNAMANATRNLSTLAEVSLADLPHHIAMAANDGEVKSKRLRKKSWRQMEAEEVQLELDESLLDDDHPFRKKRRSWKNHRLDSEEGLYACDQCKKMFSKQSSLARHKYEHSGARPFSCELCGKAFKHKHHLTEHRRLHSGEKPFMCKKCGKRFSHSGSYSQHMNHRYKYCKPMRGEDGSSSP